MRIMLSCWSINYWHNDSLDGGRYLPVICSALLVGRMGEVHCI